jgi:hypothetical protein
VLANSINKYVCIHIKNKIQKIPSFLIFNSVNLDQQTTTIYEKLANTILVLASNLAIPAGVFMQQAVHGTNFLNYTISLKSHTDGYGGLYTIYLLTLIISMKMTEPF